MPLDHILHPSLLTKTQLLTKWAPKPANAFAALATSTFNNAALSKHEKELIAIGCAHTLRCPYCIDYHTSLALEAGASHEEIIEAAWVGIISETNSSVSQFPITIDALNSDLKSYQTENSAEQLKQLHEMNEGPLKSLEHLENKIFENKTLKSSFKHLIALACAHTTRDPHSIKRLTKMALKAEFSKAQITESVWVAIEMAAGASFGHAGLTAALLESSDD